MSFYAKGMYMWIDVANNMKPKNGIYWLKIQMENTNSIISGEYDSKEDTFKYSFGMEKGIEIPKKMIQAWWSEPAPSLYDTQQPGSPVKNRKEMKDFNGNVYRILGDCPRCGCECLDSTENYCSNCGEKLNWNI